MFEESGICSAVFPLGNVGNGWLEDAEQCVDENGDFFGVRAAVVYVVRSCLYTCESCNESQ